MVALLKELLVFILEALRDSPNGESPISQRTATKKLVAIIAIIAILLAGLGSIWYESQLNDKNEVAKLRDTQNKKTISELQRANAALKEERIRLTAESKNLADMLRTERENVAKLERNLESKEDELDDQRELSENRLELIRGLQRSLDAAEVKLNEYYSGNRRIWDEVLTLGNEDRS